MRTSRTPILVIFFIVTLLIMACGSDTRLNGWNLINPILKRIVPPVFPDKDYNITEYGAVADSLTDCTKAIKTAIETCAENGGGRVVVPAGVYLTGAIHLKSGVNLYLSKNAKLLFTRELNSYLPVVLTRFEGMDLMNYSPFIYAKDVENIAITGEGVLDGNADSSHWWDWKGNTSGKIPGKNVNQNSDRELLGKMVREGVAPEKRIFGDGHFMRTNFIQFIQTKNILIEGVTIINSPMWEINPILCSNVTVRGIKVISHGPNNDGCNPESSKDVLIENCFFDTGDDCIAIKSGREEDGRRVNVPSENIIVRNCHMKDGHGGVVIGSEITGGCRNVFIENCTMDSPNLDRALRIKSNSLRGGVIENIYMRNVIIGQVKEAILHINLYYEEGDVGNYVPVVRNIYIDHVTSEASAYALWIKAYERSPVTGIYIYGCRFNGVRKGNILSHIGELKVDNSLINNKEFIIKEINKEDTEIENNLQTKELNNVNPE